MPETDATEMKTSTRSSKKAPKAMTITVPEGIASDIVVLSKKLGMHQKVVKEWVAQAAFEHIATAKSVRAIVHENIAKQLDER
jgi:hypothetical protein